MRMTTPTAAAAMTTVITITAMAIIMVTVMVTGTGITTMCPRISTAVLRLAQRLTCCSWCWS